MRKVYSVSELTAHIRNLLEEQFFEIWVEGELSNCRVWQKTGHMYFTLKDRGAQISGVMFKLSLLRLKFTPNRKYVLVDHGDSRDLVVFDRDKRTVSGTVKLDYAPKVMAISADGQRAFLTHPSDDKFSVVDLTKMRVISSVPTGKQPDGVAYVP